jgi:hypothetical protein
VHSLNYGAALAMCARLLDHPEVQVRRVPFSELLTQI